MSENLHNESLDNLFKQTFEGAKTSVPPGVWEGIAASTTSASVVTGSSILAKLIGIKGAAILGGVAVVTGTIIGINQYQNNIGDVDSIEPTKNIVVQDHVIDNPANLLDSSESKAKIQPNSSNPISNTNINTSEVVVSNNNGVATNSPVKPERNNDFTTNQVQTNPNTTPKPLVLIPSNSNDVQINVLNIPSNICLYQEVKATWPTKMPFKKIDWYVNDTKVNSGSKTADLMFTKAGSNKVTVIAFDFDGKKFEAAQSVDIQTVSADFEYTLNANMINIVATNNCPSHSWYVNNAKKANNQSRISLSTDGMQSMEIVHIATNQKGCSDTLLKTISLVQCVLEKQLEDVITPYEADGINDEWIVDLPLVDSYYLVVFASDGSIVFQTTNQRLNWNGKRQNVGDLLPAGIYTYQLVYACQGKSQQKTGKITLLK